MDRMKKFFNDLKNWKESQPSLKAKFGDIRVSVCEINGLVISDPQTSNTITMPTSYIKKLSKFLESLVEEM